MSTTFYYIFYPPSKYKDSNTYFPLLVQLHNAAHIITNNNDVCELDDFDDYVDFVVGFVDQVYDIVDQVDDIVDPVDDILDQVDDE